MTLNYYFNHIQGILCNVFDAYSSVLFLPYRKNQYYLASYFSLGDNITDDNIIEPGQGLIGWIIRNNQPILINNFDRESYCLGYYSKESESKIKAFMGCPLQNGEGALALDSNKAYSFSPKDQKILHQFVQLLENLHYDFSQISYNEQEKNYYVFLQLIRTLRQKQPRWPKFLDKFLQSLSEYTNFAYCFFAARDKNGTGYYLDGWNRSIFSNSEEHNHYFDINSGLIGWVFKNNSMVSTADQISGNPGIPIFEKKLKQPDFQSVICLPLIVNMRTRGVLVLADTENKNISHELQNFLYLVNDYLALFLENLYLKNKLRKQS